MAVISVDVPNAVVDRVATAFINLYPPPIGTSVGTAAEKQAYVKSLLIRHIKDVVASYEASTASQTASQNASQKATTEINPT